mmetsp:Transcript_32021/g.75065  ORF Transcript_32021/g.75065 Transcript_32021/m.75065 type:complete len:446 (+) Transcript_32021:127-1464(+)
MLELLHGEHSRKLGAMLILMVVWVVCNFRDTRVAHPIVVQSSAFDEVELKRTLLGDSVNLRNRREVVTTPAPMRHGDSCKIPKYMPDNYLCNPQVKMSRGGEPDFVMISPPKSGSTAVFLDLIVAHSYVSNQLPCKEMHLWDEKIPLNASSKMVKAILGAYFPSPCPTRTEFRGEATPRYFVKPWVAPLIQTHLPHVKLICILRDPIPKFLSTMWMHLVEGEIPELWLDCEHQLKQFHFLESQHCGLVPLQQGRVCKPKKMRDDPVGMGLYWPILEHWGKFFPLYGNERRLLVMPSDWFLHTLDSARADRSLQKVADYIGLPPWTQYDLDHRPTKKEHQGTDHMSKYYEAIHDESMWQAQKIDQHTKHNKKWYCDVSQLTFLRELYSPSNNELRHYIQAEFENDGENMELWDFPDWLDGYKEPIIDPWEQGLKDMDKSKALSKGH